MTTEPIPGPMAGPIYAALDELRRVCKEHANAKEILKKLEEDLTTAGVKLSAAIDRAKSAQAPMFDEKGEGDS